MNMVVELQETAGPDTEKDVFGVTPEVGMFPVGEEEGIDGFT